MSQPTVVLLRVRGPVEALGRLLEHRDVRLLDLPPRYQLDFSATHVSLAEFPPVPSPPANAPGVVVLDSGLASGHPILSPAVGDAQSFLEGFGAEDEHGHGTMVGGVALYGDVAANVEARRFVPELRLFSGRITDDQNENASGFVENHVAHAVQYFVEHYGCRIFNLSIGDLRKPYTDGHVRGLAAVLDSLAREHRVLFTISAGNFMGTEDLPTDWRREYPDYLFGEEARLIDPAPALNVLTVGSLARYEVSRQTARNPNDPAHQPIARTSQPSPFSRSGPGPLGAIKPEVVESGGNWYVDGRGRPDRELGEAELGELSTVRAFVGGNLFSRMSGTSMAAPRVAHVAGRMLQQYPNASANLLRALIVAHAEAPEATAELLNDEDRRLRLVGYGKPDWEAAIFSAEHRVALVSEEELTGDQSHYYEVPLPADFFSGRARRKRRITVALAHCPAVRTTRYDYKQSKVGFRVVKRDTLEEVVRVFRHTSRDDRQDSIREVGPFKPSSTVRGKGTVQRATWELGQVDRRWGQQKLFVVVTHTTASWAPSDAPPEPYALVVVLEDEAVGQVRYYTQVQQLLRARVRI